MKGKMKGRMVAIGLIAVSGVALACATLPLPVPPVPVQISWTDVFKAWASGYSHPLHAATMSKLDGYASTAIGQANWIANNFQGYFSYSSPIGGVAIVFIDKPCGQEAADSAEKSGEESSSSVGGGSGSWGGGSIGVAEGCYGDCGVYFGEVGEVEPV